MNDLAEKALHGLDVVHRQVRGRPMLGFAVLGLALSSTVVLAGGHVGAARSTRALTTWLGLEDARGANAGDVLPATIMLGAVGALVLLWLVVVEVIRRHDQPESRVWWVAAAWATPFAIGPPLLDTSVYSSAASGLLQRAGHDPYVAAPSRLNHADVVAAIEPGARGVPSSSGPLGTVVQHLSVSISSGSALGAVIVLRVVGVLATVWIARLATDMGGRHRSVALSMTALNPLVLLYVVSGAHLDGLMIALVLAALSLADQRRWLASVAVACVAGSVTPQGFLIVPVIITVHAVGTRTGLAWRIVGRDVAVAAATTAAIGLAVPNGFGWLWTIGKQFSGHTPFAVSSAIGQVLSPIVRVASFDDLQASGRITALTAAVCIVIGVIATARRRALERSAGYALLALALLAPVLAPWYLLWGTLCLAPSVHGARRVCVLTLTAVACVFDPPGFSTGVANLLTGIAVGIGAGVLLALAWRERSRPQQSAGDADAARVPRRAGRDVARRRSLRRTGG